MLVQTVMGWRPPVEDEGQPPAFAGRIYVSGGGDHLFSDELGEGDGLVASGA